MQHRQTISNRFIHPKKLRALLIRLFGENGKWDVVVEDGEWVLSIPRDLSEEEIGDAMVQPGEVVE